MGQWLTLPMLAVGVLFLVRALVRPPLGLAATSVEAEAARA